MTMRHVMREASVTTVQSVLVTIVSVLMVSLSVVHVLQTLVVQHVKQLRVVMGLSM